MEYKHKDIVIKFLTFSKKELKINKLPEVVLTSKREDITTTAYYDVDSKLIKVYIKNRALVDILRSVAHELVHHQQLEEGRLAYPVQDIGGAIEDEANAVAGQLIKKFCYKNIEIYAL